MDNSAAASPSRDGASHNCKSAFRAATGRNGYNVPQYHSLALKNEATTGVGAGGLCIRNSVEAGAAGSQKRHTTSGRIDAVPPK